jgi:hypothetical protein
MYLGSLVVIELEVSRGARPSLLLTNSAGATRFRCKESLKLPVSSANRCSQTPGRSVAAE